MNKQLGEYWFIKAVERALIISAAVIVVLAMASIDYWITGWGDPNAGVTLILVTVVGILAVVLSPNGPSTPIIALPVPVSGMLVVVAVSVPSAVGVLIIFLLAGLTSAIRLPKGPYHLAFVLVAVGVWQASILQIVLVLGQSSYAQTGQQKAIIATILVTMFAPIDYVVGNMWQKRARIGPVWSYKSRYVIRYTLLALFVASCVSFAVVPILTLPPEAALSAVVALVAVWATQRFSRLSETNNLRDVKRVLELTIKPQEDPSAYLGRLCEAYAEALGARKMYIHFKASGETFDETGLVSPEDMSKAIQVPGYDDAEILLIGRVPYNRPAEQLLLAQLGQTLTQFDQLKMWAGQISVAEGAVAAANIGSEQRAEFISMLAHELKNPIAGLYGTLQLLDEQFNYNLDEIQNELVDDSIEATTRLSALVSDLLIINRADWTGITLNIRNLDPEAFVEGLQADYERQFGDKVKVNLLTNKGPIFADHVRLRQVVDNLVTNAVKALESTWPNNKTGVKVNFACGEYATTIQVIDKGHGIPAEELKYVGNRFWRSSVSLSKSVNGTGLGVAVVEKIVEGHRGSFCIDSVEGSGTAVLISLPADPNLDSLD